MRYIREKKNEIINIKAYPKQQAMEAVHELVPLVI
jgi:hypothetical protein